MGDFLIILHIALGKHIVGQGSSSESVICSTECSILRISSSRLKSSSSLRRDVNLLLIFFTLNFEC